MLSVRDLSVARGGWPVLQSVSFDLAAGQALILRGPNGVGKTSLLRTLAGLQPVHQGSFDVPEGAVAYASHADGVKDALSVAQNLRFWAQVYGMPFDAEALAAFDLTALAGRPAGTLSSGQRRRLGLARLAVVGRKVLLLDEPTISLDARSVTLFADWLRLHLARGGVAVIATHIDLGLDAPTLDLSGYIATYDMDAEDAFL